MPSLTLNEQLEDLAINGYGIGWLAEHKMFWAFQFEEEDDQKINWLDGSEWNFRSDVCADDSFSRAVSRTHSNMLAKVESSTFLGKACSTEYKKLMEERAKSPRPDDLDFAERMKIEAEIETGSPEDRILTAIMEGMEAGGKIMTPEKKERAKCCFMLGYTAGHSFAKIPNEETVTGLIQDVNRVTFGNMLKE